MKHTTWNRVFALRGPIGKVPVSCGRPRSRPLATFAALCIAICAAGQAIAPPQVNKHIQTSNGIWSITQIQKNQNKGYEAAAYMAYIVQKYQPTTSNPDPNPPAQAVLQSLNAVKQQFSQAFPPKTLQTESDAINTAFSYMITRPGEDQTTVQALTQQAQTWARSSSPLADFRVEDQLLAQAGQFYSSTGVLNYKTALLEKLWTLANQNADPNAQTNVRMVVDTFFGPGADLSFNAKIEDPASTVISENPGFGNLPTIQSISGMIVPSGANAGSIMLDSTKPLSSQPLYGLAATELSTIHAKATNVINALGQIDQVQHNFSGFLSNPTAQAVASAVGTQEDTNDSATIEGAAASVYCISSLGSEASNALQDIGTGIWAGQLRAVGGGGAQMASSLLSFMDASYAPTSWPSSGAALTEGVSLFTGDYVGAGLDIFGGLFFNSAGSQNSQLVALDSSILGGIQNINSELSNLSSSMTQRFDRIDTALNQVQGSINQVYATLSQDYLSLFQAIQNLQLTENEVLSQVYQVRDGLFVLESRINTLESDMYELVGAEARIPLYNDINAIINWKIDHPISEPMPYDSFFGYFNDLYTWATDDSEQPFAIGPSQRSYDDASLATELSSYSLDTNTDYLLDQYIQYANAQGANLQQLAVTSPVPNSHDWEISAEALCRLFTDWPSNYSSLYGGWTQGQTQPAGTIYAVQEVGQGLQSAIANITYNQGQPNWQLFNFLEQKYKNNGAAFDSAVKQEETNFIGSQTITNSPYPSVNIYDTELSQARASYVPRPFWLEFGDNDSFEPNTGQGSILTGGGTDAITQSIMSLVPADYMRAEELGIGHVQAYVDFAQDPTTSHQYIFRLLIQFEPNDSASLSFQPENEGTDGNNCFQSLDAEHPVYTIAALELGRQADSETVNSTVFWKEHAAADIVSWIQNSDLMVAQHFQFPGTGSLAPENESAVDGAIQLTTVALQVAEITDLLDQFDFVPPTAVSNAVNAVTGAKLLAQGYVSLGLSRTLETNDLLKSLLSGNQRLPDGQMITQMYQAALAQLSSTGLPLQTDPVTGVDQLISSRLSAFSSAIAQRLVAIGQTGIPEIPRLMETTQQHINNVIAIAQQPMMPKSALVVAPSAIPAGTATRGIVTLRKPAPFGGLTVSLSSNSKLVTVPSTVTVSSGISSASFPVKTAGTGVSASATISARLDAVAQAVVELKPTQPAVKSVVLPASVSSGKTYRATVNLGWQAVNTGAVVTLRSSNPTVVILPSIAPVRGGESSTSFSFSVGKVATKTTVRIYALFGDQVYTQVTVNP